MNFTEGTIVIYGLHGRCSITSIETRQINGTPVEFYKLQVQKPALSRSKKEDPAIWLPIQNAQKLGLRAPLSQEQIEEVYAIFGSREYFFNIQEPWTMVYPKLEKVIHLEGALGLAKAISYLFVLKNRQVVPSSEVIKFYQSTLKALTREISDLTTESLKSLEEKIEKLSHKKLQADQ